MTLPFAIALHMLAVTVWVGGMFFAYVALRPAAQVVLDPPQRLSLWARTFDRFFPWVWVAVGLLFASGYWIIFAESGGFKGVGLHVHLMHGIAIIMTAIYFYVYFAPYQRLRRLVADQDFAAAGGQLKQIRTLVGLNLTLGLINIIIAGGGPNWLALFSA